MYFLEEYSRDSELSQNILDTLCIFVKSASFKNRDDVLKNNVDSIFGYNNAVNILFGFVEGDDLYSSLAVMDILRESLRVNSVRDQ